MSKHPDRKADDTAKPPPPTRAQRLAAAGFLGAFGLTILTVLLTGLKVGAPAARHVLFPAPVAGSSAPAPVEKTSPSAATPAEPPPTAAESKTSDDGQADAGPDRDDAARDEAARKARRKDAENRPPSDPR